MSKVTTYMIAASMVFAYLIVLSPHAEAGTNYTIFRENFEGSWPGPWSVGDENPDAGLDYWGVTGERQSEGSFSAWAAQTGTNSENGQANWVNKYQDDSMDAFMRLELRDLSGFAEVTLRFDSWLELGDGDGLSVRVRSGAGWFTLWSVEGPYEQEWKTFAIGVPLSSEALEFRYVSADSHVANLEGAYVDEIELLGLDDTPPSLTITDPDPGQWLASRTVTVAWTAADPASGLLYMEVRRDLGPWLNVGLSSTATFSGLSDGTHSITIRVSDRVGNVAMETMTFGVDVSAPTVSVLEPSEGTIITSSDVTLRWEASDSTSGVASIQVMVDSGEWVALDPSATEYRLRDLGDGTHTVRVRVTDAAGNVAEEQLAFGVDTNPFSPYGPFYGIPLYALIGLGLALLLFFAIRKGWLPVGLRWKAPRQEETPTGPEERPGDPKDRRAEENRNDEG
jgi:hypothetical protein